ncbi:MAG: zinc ribbon domain-containing protein [Armatimonadota bacterium]|nr:zinc ribbon domain-containing protein [Armatimonadota bacterium]
MGRRAGTPTQEHLRRNQAQKGGNPARVRMLSSRVFCPQCGATLRLHRHRAPRVSRYICSRYHDFTPDGARQCVPTGYALPTVEDCVVQAIEDARDRPDAIQSAMRDALSAYRSADVDEVAGSATAWRQEKRAVESALQSLAAEEVAAVQGQIAGIRAGASPDAYAAAFADIAARRKDLQDRRGHLARQIELSGRGKTGTGKTGAAGRESDAELLARAWNDVRRVMTSADVSGSVKRDAIGALIEKVVPLRRREATRSTVYFLPGVFTYPPSEGHDTLVSICALSQNTTSK